MQRVKVKIVNCLLNSALLSNPSETFGSDNSDVYSSLIFSVNLECGNA